MSESPYVAMREFIRVAVELEVRKAMETRSAPTVIEGPPGTDGKNGTDGRDGKDGRDGADGKDGLPGQRGANGISTREEMEELVERKVADINVRTFADIYRGVYKPGESYTRSNFTTWGGSLWLALTDTQSKPGETPDWKLVVKK